jgi:alkaline phosphatase D
MADLLLGPIVGGLSSERAHLWGRANGPGLLHAWLGQQADLSDARMVSTSLPLSDDNGFAGVAPLFGLAPDTHYHYALRLDDTPPDPDGAPYPEFTTFPPAGQPVSFAFAFGSCFRPMEAEPGKIFHILEEHRKQDNLRFILMIGDQIYGDALDTNGIGRIACTLQEYRDVYTHTWSQPPLRALLRNLPAFMTLDDHEVDDDWRWIDAQRQWAYIPWWNQLWRWLTRRPIQERMIPRQRVLDALQAYWEHQGMHAPPSVVPFRLGRGSLYDMDTPGAGSLAYTFNFGAAAFFVLDTRTHRVKRWRWARAGTILGSDQWSALERWLLAVKDTYPVKFIVTSSALLHRLWLDLPRDRWSGFPDESRRLLNFLAYHGIRGVRLITGDLHSAHAVLAELPGPQGESLHIWEFCSSPFEQDPNPIAGWAYDPRRIPPVQKQQRIFCVRKHNFGLVRVDFPPGAEPSVKFEVYGSDGSLLGEAGM